MDNFSHHHHSQPCPVLMEGSTGADVMRLQRLLTAQGYHLGNIDGIFGPKTRSAVLHFQANNHLVQDGIVGIKTWTALGVHCGQGHPCPTLAQGSTGSDVVRLQEMLKHRGFYTGNIDGIFGPLTRSAVIAFQRSMGLAQDGIVGVHTWTALGVHCS